MGVGEGCFVTGVTVVTGCYKRYKRYRCYRGNYLLLHGVFKSFIKDLFSDISGQVKFFRIIIYLAESVSSGLFDPIRSCRINSFCFHIEGVSKYIDNRNGKTFPDGIIFVTNNKGFFERGERIKDIIKRGIIGVGLISFLH